MRPYDELTRRGQIGRMGTLARTALEAWGLAHAPIRCVHHFHNTTFRVPADGGYALRIARPGYQSDAALRSEVEFLEFLSGSDDGPRVPEPVRTRDGAAFATVPAPDGDRRCLLFRWIPGRIVRRGFGVRHAQAQGVLAARLHVRSAGFRPPPGFERHRLDAEGLSGPATGFPTELIRRRLGAAALRTIDAATELSQSAYRDIGTSADYGIVHADIMRGNTVWDRGRPGLLDFDDSGWAPFAYDLAVVRWGEADDAVGQARWASFLDGYASVRPLPAGFADHLDALVAGRRLLVALWLSGNIGHPSFTFARDGIAREVAKLERFVAAHR